MKNTDVVGKRIVAFRVTRMKTRGGRYFNALDEIRLEDGLILRPTVHEFEHDTAVEMLRMFVARSDEK